MFGIATLIAAFKRVTTSLNRSADLIDAANERAERFLAFDPPGQQVIEHQRNGTTRAKARA